jgi:hypothetical protein
MADWYTSHLYKIYEAKFMEKFYRKSPLPQWVGFYNQYNQSFNYEVYDSTRGIYVKRMMPMKIPNVLEFSFIDNNDFMNTGLCIYRQKDTLYWFSLIFGTNMENRDDVFWTQPQSYGVRGLYYTYVHDCKFPWNNSRIAYIFADTGKTKVYAVNAADPSVIHSIDMSAVDDWVVKVTQEAGGSPDVDIRLSKTAVELPGEHSCFYISSSELIPVYAPTRIANIDVTYSEDNDDLVFKSNIPGHVWWRNRPSPGSYPPLDGEDSNDHDMPLIPYAYKGNWKSGTAYKMNQIVFYGTQNYRCTSNHTATPSNAPRQHSAPWIQFDWFAAPLGTTGYSYAVNRIDSSSLDYEYVNWRTDADREWLVGSNAIVVRAGGGFAYILLA